MPRLSLSERVLLLRRRMGLTQLQFARLLRTSRRAINTIENQGRVRRATIERFNILEKRQREKRSEKRRSKITANISKGEPPCPQ